MISGVSGMYLRDVTRPTCLPVHPNTLNGVYPPPAFDISIEDFKQPNTHTCEEAKMTTHPSVQKFAATANSNLQTFQSLADIVLDASEQLLSLNVEAARSLCAYASTQTLPLDGEELRNRFANGINVNNEHFEQATEYLRNVNEICLRAQSEIAEISTRHISEVSNSMQSLFDEVSKLTPAATLETFVTPTTNARNTARKAA